MDHTSPRTTHPRSRACHIIPTHWEASRRHVAYRRACLNAVEYLKKFGFTGEQAYLLLSCAPIEGRLSGVVDIPNACCTLALPTAIFDKNILPV